jgi:hypothetical protein
VPRPTGLPDWGQSGGASAIVQPSLDQRAKGWSGSQKPPAQYFNHHMALTYQWLKWLSYDSVIDEDFSYAHSNYFPNNPAQPITPTLLPRWQIGNHGVTGTVFLVASGTIGGQRHGNPLGAVGFQGNGSGICDVKTVVGALNGRDFLFESYVKMGIIPTGPSSYMGWGLYGGLNGQTMIAGFQSTGTSYVIGFRWLPSGAANMTGIPVTFPTAYVNTSSTGYFRYGFGREDGQYFVQFENEYQVGVGPAGPLHIDNEALAHAGMQAWAVNGVAFEVYMDKIKLGVKR